MLRPTTPVTVRRITITLSALTALASLAFAQDAIAPHSAFEPPAAKAAASLAASTKDSPKDLLTTGEKTDFTETAPYAECVDISRKLEKASRLVKVEDIGVTPEGRSMIAVIVSKDRAFTPEAAQKTDKAIIMIQSGIHAGEIEGKDPVLMLVRDMVVSKKYAAWLDKAIFVIIPVFNVDGHEDRSPYHRPSQNGPRITGLRNTAQRMNLNRDYVKGDLPEMRAWLKVFNTWMPDFLIDNHVTDGADMQYDVTWDMARNQDIAEEAGAWVRDRYVPDLNKRMEADGHLVAPYGALRNVNGRREFFMEVFSPRYSHLYSAVQNRPSLLVESHSLKAAKTRAWAHYDIMRHTFDIICADPQALRKAVRAADAEMMARAGDKSAKPVYLAGTVSSEKSRPLVYHSLKIAPFKSEVTGTMVTHYTGELDDLQTVIHDEIDTTVEAQMPLGYLIPPAFKDVADHLAAQAVQMEKTTKPIEQVFETYRFGPTALGGLTEGHVLLNLQPRMVNEKITIPAGAWWVPMKQRRSRLILAMLEPAAPDSLAAWGYLNSVFEGAAGRGGGGGGGGRGGAGGRGAAAGATGATPQAAPPGGPNPGRGGRATGGLGEYLSEPIARKMMADQPELRKQFEAKVASDPTFAADPTARLAWWYQQSKYEPEDNGRYPIVRVWEKNW